jgi:hypothetical protein
MACLDFVYGKPPIHCLHKVIFVDMFSGFLLSFFMYLHNMAGRKCITVKKCCVFYIFVMIIYQTLVQVTVIDRSTSVSETGSTPVSINWHEITHLDPGPSRTIPVQNIEH